MLPPLGKRHHATFCRRFLDASEHGLLRDGPLGLLLYDREFDLDAALLRIVVEVMEEAAGKRTV